MLRKIGIVEWGVLLAVAAGANIGCSAGEEPGLANRSGAEPNTSAMSPMCGSELPSPAA